MTNAEKYQEVFGFPPDKENCPTGDCHICPCSQMKIKGIYECMTYDWWHEEYKGNDTVKVEVTEVHTFAKPDDVSDIKFGDEE